MRFAAGAVMMKASGKRRAFLCAVLLFAAASVVVGQDRAGLPAPEGWTALESGDASRAAAIFREALDRSPQNAVLHFGAGWAAFALGRNDASIASLKRALQFDPSFAQAATLLAQVAYAASDLDLAIASLEKAATLTRDPRLRQQLDLWKKESAVHAGLDQRAGVRFRVLFEGATQKALGARVEQVLESSYWTIGKAFNSYPSETLTVVLYTDRQFRDVLQMPGWAGGAFDGRIRLAVGGALRTPAALDRVVRHELAHAIIAFMAPRNVPAWLHEGLATAFESSDRTWIRRALLGVREVYRLDDLAGGFDHLDGAGARVAYAESAIAGEILLERLGPNLGVFVQMVGSGQTVDQALAAVNVAPETFHAEWRRRLNVR